MKFSFALSLLNIASLSISGCHGFSVDFPPPSATQMHLASTVSIEKENKKCAPVASFMSQHAVTWFRELILPQPAFAAETPAPPTNAEIEMLRNAFAAFYGANRDAQAAEPLLTKAIQAWELQPNDEKAGLYRVRGDCFMVLLKPQEAIRDYTTAINLLQGPEGDRADPGELPSSLYVSTIQICSPFVFNHFSSIVQTWESACYS
jgi:hypothetical protein